jgi:hypothetical protein
VKSDRNLRKPAFISPLRNPTTEPLFVRQSYFFPVYVERRRLRKKKEDRRRRRRRRRRKRKKKIFSIISYSTQGVIETLFSRFFRII